jgi:uncharacterized Tic20 family protein
MDLDPTPTNPSPPQPALAAASLSPSDERTWAMLAHLSVLLNLVTGFLGVIAALAVYIAYKDRSRYVAYQSMQAFIFQLIWWFGGAIVAGLAWAATGVLSMVLIGLIFIPVACLISLIPLASLVYGILAAVQCNSGQDFHYWLIGDWVRGELVKS